MKFFFELRMKRIEMFFLGGFFLLTPGNVNAQFGSGTNSPLPVTIDGTASTGIYIGKGGINHDQNSTAVGVGALLSANNIVSPSVQPASFNTAIGANALKSAVNNRYNVAIGFNALTQLNVLDAADKFGNDNVAVGAYALSENISGYYNTGVGYGSLYHSTGNNNCAIGLYSSQYATGGGNSAMGNYALGNFGSGGYNCAFGMSALSGASSATGSFNNAFGYSALSSISSGTGNIGIGATTLNTVTSGHYNVGIGYASQVQTSTLSYQLSIQNVIYGRDMQAGATHGNVGIGVYPIVTTAGTLPAGIYAKLKVAGVDNGISSTSVPSLQLDYVPVNGGTSPLPNPNGRYLFVDAAGVVSQAPLPPAGSSITTTCPTPFYLTMNGTTANTIVCSQVTDNGGSTGTVQIGTGNVGTVNFSAGSGYTQYYVGNTTSTGSFMTAPYKLYVNGWTGSTGFVALSDQRLKKEIKKIEKPLERISRINGYTYNWNKDYKTGRKLDDSRQAGFLAQEIEKVLPEAVVKNDDGILGLNYNGIMPLLAEGIKEQQEEIKAQDLKIQNLELQITDLRNKLNQLTPWDSKIKVNSLEVIPNPITGTSTVSYKLDNATAASFLIIADLQGKLLKQISLARNIKEGQLQVSKKDLANGMYIFSLVSGNAEIQSKKVLVAE